MKKTINVQFTVNNNDDPDSYCFFLSEKTRTVLKNGIVFEYDEQTTIKELYQYALFEMDLEYEGQLDSAFERILGWCDNCMEKICLSFPLERYIQLHGENDTIWFAFRQCVGGSALLKGLVKIIIHTREKAHSGHPHIHLTSPEGHSDTLSYSLISLGPITKDDEKVFKKLF